MAVANKYILTPQEIQAAVFNFLDLLENGQADESQNISALVMTLDQLALASHSVIGDTESDYPDPPAQDYNQLRTLVASRFPRFGYYNVPDKLTDEIMETQLQVGDALDDIADIARDLYDVKWCWEHTSERDALWHFRFGYETHWGEHLRYLQLYLFKFREESQSV